jgi:NADP-dependent 3-hydroxy acid dehydrogenase YdfG
VNISSVAGRVARPTNGVYAATKFGLNGWSESLRQELLPNVRVAVVEPGAVATELADHITDDETKRGVEEFYAATAIAADASPHCSTVPASSPR